MEYAVEIEGITTTLKASHLFIHDVLIGCSWPFLSDLLTQYQYRASSILRLQYSHILPVLSCQAVDGHPNIAIPIAASWQCRLLAAQLLDDIQDGTSTRGWEMCSTDEKLMMVTFLQGAAEKALAHLDVSQEQMRQVAEKMANTTMLAARGQCLPAAQNLESYFDKLSRKTALLFGTACWAGAAVGNTGRELTAQLETFGWHIGAMRQIVDDCADLREDVRHGEWTLPILYILSLPIGNAFQEMLSKPGKSTKDVETIMAYIADHQAVEWALRQAAQRKAEAVAIAKTLPFQKQLLDYVHLS